MTPHEAGLKRFAAVDIGTNSVLLLVVERQHAGLAAILDRSVITRLGRGVDHTRQLAPDAVERTLDCLRSYAADLHTFDVQAPLVVGTSALRDAIGAEAFLDEAQQILGVRPRIISGTEEAQLSFGGALSGLDFPGSATVFDVGGGSTEFVEGRAEPSSIEFRSATSINVGAVRLHERHIRHDPPAPEELLAVQECVRQHLPDPRTYRSTSVIGVGGTVTTLVAISKRLVPYDGTQVHGAKLTLVQLNGCLLHLSKLNVADRSEIVGLEPRRADVIVVGAAIVCEVMKWLNVDEVTVSDRGLRWGLVESAASSERV